MSADGYRRYAAYQPSGNLALGAVPADWQVSRIAHVFVKSNAGEVIDKSYWGDGSELLYTCNRTPMKSDFSVFPQWKRTVPNDLLLTRNGTPYVHKPTEGAIYSNVVQRITLAKEYSRDYLSYCLGNSALGMRGYGVSIESFNFDNWKSLRFTHPPLKEQTQIARFLDYETAKIDALIEKQQQLIALLKEKRQAVISHAVTKGLNPDAPMRDSGVEWLGEVPAHWEVGALSYALNAIGDVDHYMPPSVEEGVPYVMTGDLEELASEIDFTRCKQVAHHDYRRLCKKIKTTKGDLIMARYATIGTVSYVDLDSEFLVSYSCVTIKPNTGKALGRYLFFCLKSDSFVQGIQERINTNTQGNVGIADLRKVKVALPGIEEQLRITEYLRVRVAAMGKVIESSEATIDLLQERRAALISAAVTGKIDVRKWQSPDDE